MLKRIRIFWKLSAAFFFITLLVLLTNIILGDSGSQRTIVIIAITSALSCGSAWFFMKFIINKPIRRLEDGMNKLAEKEFDFRLEEDEEDEFGSLASSFNDMASMLSSSLNELKKNRDYAESILESSADIIITVNSSGNIQTINAGAEKTLGHDRVDIIGEPIAKLFVDPRQRKAAIEKMKHSDNVVNFETQFLTKGGEARDVLLTLSHLRNPSGEIIGTIGISKDITEEKRLQNKLIQSQRLAAIGQVFTGIQHSMKNMLNACKGGAYMVKIGLAKDKRKMLEEGWAIVEEGISRLTDMSRDMLKYVKDFKPKYAKVDLAQTLSDINRVISQTAKNKGVEFKMDISPELPPVLCDGGMIHSATMDIVSNALDACLWKDYSNGESPEVVVRAYTAENGKDSVIEVQDNGCGMTEDVKANIFTPFFSTKSKAGTGLGLSITSRMIGVHSGKIDVESEPDKGSIFRIVIPIDATRKKQGED